MKKILSILVCTLLCNVISLNAAVPVESRCAACGGKKSDKAKPKSKKYVCKSHHHKKRGHRNKCLKIPHVKFKPGADFNFGPA